MQRLHQVDPVLAVRTLLRRNRLAGALFVDEIDEGCFVLVLELVGLEPRLLHAVGPGAENVSRIPVPEGISPRMQNLYLLELDL